MNIHMENNRNYLVNNHGDSLTVKHSASFDDAVYVELVSGNSRREHLQPGDIFRLDNDVDLGVLCNE